MKITVLQDPPAPPPPKRYLIELTEEELSLLKNICYHSTTVAAFLNSKWSFPEGNISNFLNKLYHTIVGNK